MENKLKPIRASGVDLSGKQLTLKASLIPAMHGYELFIDQTETLAHCLGTGERVDPVLSIVAPDHLTDYERESIMKNFLPVFHDFVYSGKKMQSAVNDKGMQSLKRRSLVLSLGFGGVMAGAGLITMNPYLIALGAYAAMSGGVISRDKYRQADAHLAELKSGNDLLIQQFAENLSITEHVSKDLKRLDEIMISCPSPQAAYTEAMYEAKRQGNSGLASYYLEKMIFIQNTGMDLNKGVLKIPRRQAWKK
ncbi:hypothetical protein ACFL3V_03820 [Nanoarchaeota archaeon]